MCRESTALQGQSLKEPKVLLRTSRSGQAVPLRSLELSRVAGAVAGQRPQWSLATGSSRGTSVFTMLELESHVTAALRRCYTTLFLARCPWRPWLALQRQRPCAHLPCTSQRWPWPYCHGLPTSGHRFCRSQLTAGGPASRPSLWLSYTMPANRAEGRELGVLGVWRPGAGGLLRLDSAPGGPAWLGFVHTAAPLCEAEVQGGVP